MFEEGRNILSARCMLDWQGAETVIMDAQIWGSDHLSGRQAAEISAQSKLVGGNPMPGTFRQVLAEMPLSQKELQLRTKMAVMAMQTAFMRVKLSYQGWLNPAGALWDVADMVTVKSPMLFPVEEARHRADQHDQRDEAEDEVDPARHGWRVACPPRWTIRNH